MNKIFLLEDRIKKWIENNRFKWCLILFCFGIVLSILQNSLLHTSLRQYTTNAFYYGSLLVVIEVVAGGGY